MVQATAFTESGGLSPRDRILRAALAEILETGFFETSVDRIAARAGASKQTLYALFQSRDQLFRELLLHTVGAASSPPPPDLSTLDFAGAVRAYVQWVERSSADPANLELYRANVAAGAAFPELAAELHRLRTGLSRFSTFMAGQPAPSGLSDIPSSRLSSWLGVLAIGGVRQLLGLMPPSGGSEAWQGAIVQLFSGGWRVAPAHPASSATDTAPPLPPPSRPIEENGRVGAARWTEMLRLAVRSFAQLGYRHTSVDQIGALAGIAKMTVYRRFGSKEGVFAAALDQAVDDLVAHRRLVRLEGDPAAALQALALDLDRFAQHPDHTRLIRLMVTEAPAHPEAVQRAWLRLVLPDRAALAGELERWRAAGLIAVADCGVAAEQFLILATRGNRRLTDAIPWDEAEAVAYARETVALAYR